MTKLTSQSAEDTEEDDEQEESTSLTKVLPEPKQQSSAVVKQDTVTFQQLEQMKKDVIETINLLFNAQREELKEIVKNSDCSRFHDPDVVLISTDC